MVKFSPWALFLTVVSATAATSTSATAAPRKKVVTTFTVLADIATQIGGPDVDVQSLTKPGAEIHGYEPTPLDLVRAQDADLILWNGLGLERWFERFYGKLHRVPRVVLSDGVVPLGINEGAYNGKANPHAWVSLRNAHIYVANVERALSQLDPPHAAHFAANAERYRAQLDQLERDAKLALSTVPASRRWLASGEGAFSYLARDLAWRELYLWPVNADQQGTPRQVQRAVDTLRRFGIPVMFSESTVSPKAVQAVAREAGARYGGALFVDSLSDAGGPAPTYFELLRYNLKTLTEAFGVGDKSKSPLQR